MSADFFPQTVLSWSDYDIQQPQDRLKRGDSRITLSVSAANLCVK